MDNEIKTQEENNNKQINSNDFNPQPIFNVDLMKEIEDVIKMKNLQKTKTIKT